MIRFSRLCHAFLLTCLLLGSIGCGEDPARVRTRVKFLSTRGKIKEALEEGLKGARGVPKEARGDVLLDVAEVAIKIYRESGQKSDGLKALEILQQIIDEKLVLDGRPFFLTARIFQQDKQYDKAVDYLKKAEDVSRADPQQAGMFRYYMLEILRQTQQGDLLMREAQEFYKKYPSHDRLKEVEKWDKDAQGLFATPSSQ